MGNRLIFRTRFEIIVEHTAPMDPERVGEAMNRKLNDVFEHGLMRGNARKMTLNIVEYNKMGPE